MPSKNPQFMFVPTEESQPFSDENTYIMRAPGGVLKYPKIVADFVADAARIGHTNQVNFRYPLEQAKNIQIIKTRLGAQGFSFSASEIDQNKIISPEEHLRLSFVCMDRRSPKRLQPYDEWRIDQLLNDIAEIENSILNGKPSVHKPEGEKQQLHRRSRLRLPGAALLMHPKIKRELKESYQQYIEAQIDLIGNTQWKIDKLVPHVGINVNGSEAKGCGGTALANQVGAEINHINDLWRYMEEIRDKYHKFLTTNCAIYTDAIFPDGSVMRVDQEDFKIAFDEKIKNKQVVL